MKYLPSYTLKHHSMLPQLQKVDISAIPVEHFGVATKHYRVNCGQVVADEEAVIFYAANHLAALVRNRFTPSEALPGWAFNIMEFYRDVLNSQGLRAFHYLMSITTREMRHLKGTTCKAGFWQTVESKFGPEFTEFLKNILKMNETQAVSAYMSSSPKCSVGKYTSGLSYAFHQGSWNSAYGGKKWGIVTDACDAFVHGKTSMEAMIDTSYTLAHNGGPIFNKGMMYSGYTHNLITLLDIQRSGQIPDMLLDSESYGGLSKPNNVVNLVKMAREHMPEEFTGYVDWYKVEALGSVHKYPQFKEAQNKHKVAAASPEKKAAMVTQINGKKVIPAGTWDVFPGQTVQVYERVKA